MRENEEGIGLSDALLKIVEFAYYKGYAQNKDEVISICSMAISDQVKIIDDVITREVEFADEPTDDIQNAWMDIKMFIIVQEALRKYEEINHG